MGHTGLRRSHAAAWKIARRQHGVVARDQLLGLGLSSSAITHGIAAGRMHRVHRGVYAAGRPDLTQHGRWMAAVLACGPDALLSHASAAALWGLRSVRPGDRTHVSVPACVVRRVPGIVVRRRAALYPSRRLGVPVTDPISTLVDIASLLTAAELEATINEADKLGLFTPDELRAAAARRRRCAGTPAVRAVLDRHTFVLTDSELERRFLRLVRATGLTPPQTGRRLNGFRVDFFWPELRLVVETDGLRYHRTPAAQARDRRRDQAHAAAGFTALRFTHAQIAYEPQHVKATLEAVAARLAEAL